METAKLIERLKEYNGNTYVSMTDDVTIQGVNEWIDNFCEESFVTDEERLQAIDDALNSRVCDIVQVMENE